MGSLATAASRVSGLPADLVDRFVNALCAQPFRAAAGIRVGAALADIGGTDPDFLSTASAELFSLAELWDPPEKYQRLPALLAALGQGYQQRRQEVADNAGARSARRITLQEQRFRLVFEHASVAIAIGDTEGRLLEANQALADMIGVPVEALRGISVYEFAHPDDRAEIRSRIYEHLVPARGGSVKLERRLVRADGSRCRLAFTITFIRGGQGHDDYLLAIGEDVTHHHRLRHQAHHDPLTGLPNRRHLLEQIDAVICAATASTAGRIGLCFIDVDNFKHVNDRYGHRVGDQTLMTVARRLRTCAVPLGCRPARWGGDEFVVLIPPPVDEARLVEIADHLREASTAEVEVAGHRIRVSASIGVVSANIAGIGAETLLEVADAGLRRAKAEGRGRWVMHSISTAPGLPV
ncbi:sensor domain-containing diguanylate cyclase [Nocardia paucivorans]|uniref:sensor domain-containing diguanylate cyclase n=1 Tax=Nocardia paucivorans TaxID=114259 RepID=UPI000688B294|nr:sensor domain-containing diguanylate cyclase [Nocardia paucivorans]